MKKAILFIAIVVIYLIVRFSDINKPLDYNGWSTAHSLITQQIWYKGGIQNYNFSPVYTFNNLKDKNIDNLGGIKDAKGNYYYVSYPPFSFLLPFIIFKLLGIYPSLLPLNIFNAFLHVASAIFVYLLISLVLKKEKQIGVNHEAFFGFILYLFSPGNFWFYTNIYFADILVNTFFIAGVYFILKIIRQENFFSAKYLLFFGIIVLAGVYTEWLGLFFPISVLLYSIIKTKQDKRYLMLFSVTIIFTLISIFLTLYQYTSISGFSNLINEMQHKFLSRGGFSSLFNLKFFMNIIYFYKTYYLSEILVLVVLSLISFYFLRRNIRKWLKDIYIFLYFALVPVTLHYLFFYNFNSNHSFSTLKASLLLIVAISFLIHKLVQLLFPKTRKLYYIFMMLLISGSVFIYTQHSFSNYGKYDYQLLGKSIKENTVVEDNIFICGYPDGFIEPQVLYYSHRNIRSCNNIKDAKNIVNKLKIGKSTVFTLDQERKIINMEKIDD